MTTAPETSVPPGWRDWRVFLLCFAVAAIDGFDTLLMSFIAPALSGDWSLTDGQLGQLFTAGLVGAAAGAFGSGLMADRFGRKPVLLACVALFTATTLACAIAETPNVLLALRLIGGLGLGGAIPAVAAMTAESTAPDRRSIAVTQMFIGFPVGAVVGGALSAWLVEAHGWRSAFVLGGILPALLLPALYVGLKDQRNWYGKPEEAAVEPEAGTPGGVLSDGRALAAVCLWTAAFLILLLGYFLVSWTPMMLARAGFAEGRAALGAVVLNLGGVIGALVISRAFPRFGAFRPVGLALILGAGAIAALGHFLHLSIAGTAVIFLTGALVIGAQLSLPTMAADLFPKRLRATGVGTTMAVGRVGSIIGPLIGGAVLGLELGRPATFLIVAVPAVAGGLALFLLAKARPGPQAA